METITVECPKCHGSLHVEQGTEKMFCMYCRAEVVVRETKKNDIATSDSLINRGFLLVEHGDWEKALEVFDKAANIDPENAQIYLGMLLAETKSDTEGKLGRHRKLLSEYTSYQKAIRFADDELRQNLETYNELTVKARKRRKEKKKQQEVAESRSIAQVEKELKRRRGWFHWIFEALRAFVYSILICEIFSLSANGEPSLVNMYLFRYWDEYNSPFMIIVVFLVIWVIAILVISGRQYAKMRKKIEKELSGRE